ncbi:unnamed protein product [Brassicogethes aeneus]|uniref:Uncharacterized protein n=1 Tax=Brassicogethes aeneus TaxID=1431903 RepID=A0A9P0BBL0_BRAAE|nr:unnamed protein product [Brassicogethes aeneus]
MMALRILPILQVIITLCMQSTFAVPIYGTKRYGQSYRMTPYYPMVRSTRHPTNYPEVYPSTGNYDEYYTPDGLPIYYPKTSKYEVYQAVMPYYYQERPLSHYNYYYDDPYATLQEELLAETEREEREDSQPIGHEVMYQKDYEHERDDTDDTRVAFLQNLILTQMYNDKERAKQQKPQGYDGYDYDLQQYDEPYYSDEDKDVDDLKELARNQNKNQQIPKQTNEYLPHWYNKKPSQKVVANLFNTEAKRGNVNQQNQQKEVKHNERKMIFKVTPTEQPIVEGTSKGEGQKEIVMMRPATPVRNPFSNQVLEMMSKSDDKKKRSPSVYDTIKKMLEMEKSLENKQQSNQQLRPTMKKRIISSEDSLIKQLTVLKKAQ